MIKKIGVMGAHGTGKTTLVKYLAGEFHPHFYVRVIDEVARTCPFPINKEMSLQSQRWMVARQIALEHLAEVARVVICDRTVLDPVVYAYWKAFSVPIDERSAWFKWLAVVEPFVVAWMDTYDEIIWCRPNGDLPAADGVRDPDPAFQTEIDSLFGLFIQSNGLLVRLGAELREGRGARVEYVINEKG